MSFKTSTTIETGLSDYHKMTITVMKSVLKITTPSNDITKNLMEIYFA